MKKFFTIFFVILGVIFFVIIVAGAYFFIADPLNLKPLLFNSETQEEGIDEQSTQEDKNPALSEEQEKTLESFGVDPSTLPSEITPEQEECFEDKLGEERVSEIKAGDSPTPTEYFKARDCL